MKIAVLCNFSLGLPAIDYLLGTEQLVGLAAPMMANDNIFRLQMIAQEKKLPFAMISDQNIEQELKDWTNKCKADAVFIFTFPFKIPGSCLNVPPLGFYNFHTGLLPEYRGGDPVFWQIAQQAPEGGITVHKVDEKFDHGQIVHIQKLAIDSDETYGQHIQKLAMVNRQACEHVVTNFQSLQASPQDESRAKFYNRPAFFEMLINWDEMASPQIKALVKASNPLYGGALTFFRGVPVHLLQVSIGSSPKSIELPPGSIVSSSKDGIIVLSKDQRLIRLDVLYTEDGFFTGGKLATTFSIKEKEQFTMPPNLPDPKDLQK